ncbi:Mbeg1-like protein [Cohnella yongneupensis]|uniref:Mbeg1-like protein n=1 Tax=Cohnella yongneupensis TaxID=425006 RepID=A0ABW0QV64_9BACL
MKQLKLTLIFALVLLFLQGFAISAATKEPAPPSDLLGASDIAYLDFADFVKKTDSEKRKVLDQYGLKNFVYLAKQNKDGFQAVAFKSTDSKKIIIAFRGSDQFMQDWVVQNGGSVVSGIASVQAELARKFTKKILADSAKDNSDVFLTGHSLGGWLAQRIALDQFNEKRFKMCVTFNAPGFYDPKTAKTVSTIYKKIFSAVNPLNMFIADYVIDYLKDTSDSIFTDAQWKAQLNGTYDTKVWNYVINGDLVGDLHGNKVGRHIGKTIMVTTSKKVSGTITLNDALKCATSPLSILLNPVGCVAAKATKKKIDSIIALHGIDNFKP